MFRIDSLAHVALGKLILGLRVLERELYLRFVYLPIYPSIASKGKQRRNRYIKESRKGDFEIRDLFSQGMEANINGGS